VLAAERARSIAAHLAERGIDGDRIRTGRIGAAGAGGGQVIGARLEVDVET
jgi:outer membrane protein OmpA-like peptidoglycan-associated protein